MLNLKLIRKSKNLSQQEVANHLGVSRSTVAMWEIGSSQPDLETVSKLADFFGVSIDYLLGRDETSSEPQHVNDDEALEYLDELHKRPEMKILFQVTRRATKDDIQTAITVIEALKKKGGESDD